MSYIAVPLSEKEKEDLSFMGAYKHKLPTLPRCDATKAHFWIGYTKYWSDAKALKAKTVCCREFKSKGWGTLFIVWARFDEKVCDPFHFPTYTHKPTPVEGDSDYIAKTFSNLLFQLEGMAILKSFEEDSVENLIVQQYKDAQRKVIWREEEEGKIYCQ